MTPRPLLQGRLVRLVPFQLAEADLATEMSWTHDSDYLRLADAPPVRPWPLHRIREDYEKFENGSSEVAFAVRTLEDDRFIGGVELSPISLPHRAAWLGIGIGERDFWGHGYGTDAMHEIVRYGFAALDLHRISLNVFAYNQRAVRCYEKVGFVHEGVYPEMLLRDGRRYDLIHMGILQAGWLADHPEDAVWA